MATRERAPTGPDTRPNYVEPLRGGSGPGSRGGGSGGGYGGGSGPGGGGGGFPTAPAQLMAFPPDYFPPQGATDFFVQGVSAGMVAGAPVVLGFYQLPTSERGVIRSVTVGVGNFSPLGAVLFSLRINGANAPGWGGLFVPPQSAGFVASSIGPDETRIEIPGGALVELVGQVTAGGPFDLSGSAHGWHWGGL